MKLTEEKLKKLILEVISETDDYYDPQFKPPSKERAAISKAQQKQASTPLKDEIPKVKTVGDFFKSMDFFETLYSERKGLKSMMQAAFSTIPIVGAAANAGDAAEGVADFIRKTNDGSANLTMEEAEFPLLAFIDLDPEIEKTFPTLISNWLKQLNEQLDTMGLTKESPMPNADDLFLDWVETTEWGCIAKIARDKISDANEDYERSRREFSREQQTKSQIKSSNLLDKGGGYQKLYKTVKSES